MPKNLKSVAIECTGRLVLKYNPHSKEFKESFDSFKRSIDRIGNVSDMLLHVAHNLTTFGHETMVDGVGYVYLEKTKPDKEQEPWSGIWIVKDHPDFEYEIQ